MTSIRLRCLNLFEHESSLLSLVNKRRKTARNDDFYPKSLEKPGVLELYSTQLNAINRIKSLANVPIILPFIFFEDNKVEITLYQIDAFATKVFEGNPAAICPLDTWLGDELMQSIAAENNLSETAFFVPKGTGYEIRWFTPVNEVDLCGHATLAAAYVLFNILDYNKDKVEFYSKSGLLAVVKDNDFLTLDFPAQPPVSCDVPETLVKAFGLVPIECLKSKDYIAVFEHERDVELANPDLEALKQLDLRGVIITARSERYDYVTRFFAPKYGIPEDPVTGSAYTQLVPYWESKTGLKKFTAKQVSTRSGELTCEIVNERVLISGKAIRYLEGKIEIET